MPITYQFYTQQNKRKEYTDLALLVKHYGMYEAVTAIYPNKQRRLVTINEMQVALGKFIYG